MYEINFAEPIHIYFIGIGGISMSGLAEILHTEGFAVSGSDAHASPLTQHLSELGIPVAIGESPEHIPADTEAVVFTAAIHPDNLEYREAERRGLPMLTRAELLGQIMRNYSTAIAVAGTHGKTTTTSMTAQIFLEGGLDPTVSVGGILPSIGGNIRIGESENFITEACEYTNSFLSFYPTIAMILNVDADHLDFFKDLDDIASSFHRFAELVPSDGTLIIGKDTAKFDTVTEGLTCRIVTFGFSEGSDYTAKEISYNDLGDAAFTCLEYGKELGSFTLRIPGQHNILNALAAIAAGRAAGVSPEAISRGLSTFTGAKRRFEIKGRIGGDSIAIIDDYAHHPSEISATLAAARQYPHREMYVVFQPHTYTRTKALLPEFADALSGADHVLLADIYAAREKNTIGISSDDLRAALEEKGTDAKYYPSFEKIEDDLLTRCVENDIIITMGAGDVFKVGEDLLGNA